MSGHIQSLPLEFPKCVQNRVIELSYYNKLVTNHWIRARGVRARSVICNRKQELWSFIQTTKATQSASLKVLQRFVVSLSENELRHVIGSYLKSTLSPDFIQSTCKHV
eukprot:1010682_1